MYTAIIWWWKVCLAVLCMEGVFSQIRSHLRSITSRNPLPKSLDPPLMRYPVKSQAHPVPGFNDILESLHHKFSCRNTNDCYYIPYYTYVMENLKDFNWKVNLCCTVGQEALVQKKCLCTFQLTRVIHTCQGYVMDTHILKGGGHGRIFLSLLFKYLVWVV